MPKLWVVIVDDEREILFLTEKIVRRLGGVNLDITLAYDGQAGAEAIESRPGQRPDLVITDNLMPRRTGMELGRTYAREIPMILVSGTLTSDIEEEAHAMGMHFLAKPYTMRQLLTTVRSFFTHLMN